MSSIDGRNLSKNEQMRLDGDRMVECIKQGWSKEDIQKFWRWSNQKYASILRMVRNEIKDYIDQEGTTNLDEEVMQSFVNPSAKKPQVKKWTDPRTGKVWNDVSEFWGI